MESFLHDISWVVPYRSSGLTVLFDGFTWLGYTPFFLLFLPLGYWLWDKQVFTRLAVLIIMTGLLNGFLKDLFQDPRPPVELSIDPRPGGSFGLPSGHAQVAVAMWLWLAFEIKRAWAWAVAVFIAFGVCLSRIYVGVHDVEDVLGGALLGLATIAVYRVLVSDEFKFWHDANPMLQLAGILAVQPLVWFMWPGTNGPGGSFALFGFLLGWWGGVILDRSVIHYARPANLLIAAPIAVVAASSILIGYRPLEQALMTAGLSKMAASYAVSTGIGLYSTVVIPVLLRALRVSRPAPS
jgi:glycerophosphoryl diester phosphodiesterase